MRQFTQGHPPSGAPVFVSGLCSGRAALSLVLLLTACGRDVGVTVHNTAPEVTITTPQDGASLREGETVALAGTVGDQQDEDPASLTLRWYADDTEICAGSAADADGLVGCSWIAVMGTSAVRLVALDSSDASAEDSVDVAVEASAPPTITITGPDGSAELYVDLPVSLAADVGDEETAGSDLIVSWESDAQGVLVVSSGAVDSSGEYSGSVGLDAGVHVLTATVTDESGKTDVDQVTVSVHEENTAPTCAWVSPVNDELVSPEDTLHLIGDVGDGETAADLLDVAISSDVDGAFDGTVAVSSLGVAEANWAGLSGGPHVLSLTVRDALLESCVATVNVLVCGDRFYVDADGDGLGDPAVYEVGCVAPSGYVDNDDDCDDSVASCTSDCVTDADIDGLADCADTCLDADGDGYGVAGGAGDSCTDADCDDTDGAVSPVGTELCDTVDNDCDGYVDEDDAADATTWYADADADGYGDASVMGVACSQPSGSVADATDCDDTEATCAADCSTDADADGTADCADTCIDADGDGYGSAGGAGDTCADADCDDTDGSVSPAATEVCDTVDNDCDGTVDESDASDASTWYADADADGYGDAAVATVACTQPSGSVADASDCDDGVATCTTDCATDVDADATADCADTCIDADGDGYGSAGGAGDSCVDADCDDTDGSVSPAATEVCDAVDNDCDGTVDESDASDASTWYADADADGYGDAAVSSVACDEPRGMVADDTDCDDAAIAVNPGETEVCDNGLDDDCDGSWNACNTGTADLSTDAYALLYGNTAGANTANAIAFVGDVDGDGGDDLVIGSFLSDNYASEGGEVHQVSNVDGTRLLYDVASQYQASGSGDYFGSSVAGGGDFNGDGTPDVLTGASGVDWGSTDNGMVWVSDGADMSTTIFRAYGNYTTDLLGSGAAFVDDIDGDGDDEAFISAYWTPNGYASKGVSYLIYGGVSGTSNAPSAAAAEFVGEATGDHMTGSQHYRGQGSLDFDGDGVSDLTTGSAQYASGYGRAYIFLDAAAWSGSVSAGAADVIVTGDSGDYLGQSVRGIGDLNDDGYGDWYVGSPITQGEGHVAFGAASPAASLGVSDFDITFTGTTTWAGVDAVAADFDNDGFDDLAIGEPDCDTGASNGGGVYVMVGPLSAGSLGPSDADLFLHGAEDENVGWSLDAGDYDADGDPDLAVGTITYSSSTGAVYIWATEGW